MSLRLLALGHGSYPCPRVVKPETETLRVCLQTGGTIGGIDLFRPLLTALSCILPMYLSCCLHPYVEVPLCSVCVQKHKLVFVFLSFIWTICRHQFVSRLNENTAEDMDISLVSCRSEHANPITNTKKLCIIVVRNSINGGIGSTHGETSSNGQAITGPSDRQVVQRCTSRTSAKSRYWFSVDSSKSLFDGAMPNELWHHDNHVM